MSKSQLLIDVLEIELEAIESGTARIREALADAVVEVRAHRAMVKRLEEWAEELEAESRLENFDMSVRGRVAGIAAKIRSEIEPAAQGEPTKGW